MWDDDRTTVDDIRRWIKDAQAKSATHLIVMCDTFDYGDYPVPCSSKEEAEKRIGNPGSMQKVMEVYNLNMDIERQINAHRAWNL